MKTRILIVDDSLTTLTYCADVLERAGYEVETCDNVWIASAVSRFRPDLILMDVQLGVLAKGDVAVKALANRRFMVGVKVLLHSSIDAAELATLARDCHANGFVQKGTGDAALLRAIAAQVAAGSRSGTANDAGQKLEATTAGRGTPS